MSQRRLRLLCSSAGRAARRIGGVIRSPTGLSLIAYALVTVVFTWPVAALLATRIAGRAGDLRIALWDIWWFEKAIHDGISPFHTPYLFYPEGVSLAYHSISWTSAAIAFPLRALFGAVAGYNLMFLFQTFLCAASMFALASYVVKQTLPAWLAGFIFAFEPFRMSRAMHHPNLAGTGFIPLVFLGALRAWRERRPLFAWLAALALALVLLTGAHLFIMTVIALGLLFVAEAFRERALRDPAFWKVTAQLGLACVVLVGPLVFPYVRSREALDEAIESVSRYGSTDLAALVIVSPHQSLFGDRVDPRLVFRGSESDAYLGLVSIGLALVAPLRRATRRESLVWYLLFFFFLVLSLGPRLVVAGHKLGIPLPYGWFDQFRIIQALRAPERFNLVARAFLAILAAFGFVGLRALLGRRARFADLIVPLVMLDYLCIPHPTLSVREPKFYRDLARRGGTGAIVELPLERGAAKRAMLSQTVHGRPLVGGMVARTPRAATRYIEASPLLRSLAGERPRRPQCKDGPLRRELRRLRSDGIEYFVVRKVEASRQQQAVYYDFLGSEPSFSDRAIDVYPIQVLLERHSLPCERP